MSTQIDQWRIEHRNFARLLDLMDRQLATFHEGKRPDYELMRDVMYYMTHFPDRYHHPFEDVVFNRVASRDEHARETVEALLGEHQHLAESGLRLVDDLEGIVSDALISRERVEADAAEYTQTMREHMRREEQELFPRIEKTLTLADWEAMKDELETVEDPIFGATVGDRYQSIHRQIAAHADCDCFTPKH